MTRKAADLSDMLARKGEARPSEAKLPPPLSDPGKAPPPLPDGRSLRRTGRVQWNLKVKPETKAAAFEAAAREGLTIGEIVERAIDGYLSDR